MYGSAVAVGAIGRGFLRVDRVERLQQRPIAKIDRYLGLGLGIDISEPDKEIPLGSRFTVGNMAILSVLL